MSRRRFLVIVAPLVVLGLAVLAAGGLWLARPKKVMVTITTSGTSGLAVKGTAQVDGTSQDLKGAVPAQFVLEGTRVIFSVSTPDDSGEMRVKAAIGDTAFGSKTSRNPPKYGVRGWVQSRWGWSPPATWVENFDPEADQGWASPPP
jgi:hypothetical protein